LLCLQGRHRHHHGAGRAGLCPRCRCRGANPLRKGQEEMSSKGKDGGKPGIDAAAVRELAELLKETGLTEIEIEHNGARIRVSRSAGVAVAAPAPAASAPAPASSGPAAGAVPSPMVGTVYLSPEPGKPAFISVGKTVKEG